MLSITEQIKHDLLGLAREELIPFSPTCTTEFLNDPDGVDQHHPKWHQYGILTHTLKCLEALDNEVFPEIKRLNKDEFSHGYLSELIDGMSRGELLNIALLWHDLGKWRGRKKDEKGNWDFKGHEALSEQLIRELELGKRYGLSDKQQDHVARLTGLHYIMAPAMRDVMRQRLYTSPPAEKLLNVCRKIYTDSPDYYPEICLMVMCDTLGKGVTNHPEQRRQTEWGWETFRQGVTLVGPP